MFWTSVKRSYSYFIKSTIGFLVIFWLTADALAVNLNFSELHLSEKPGTVIAGAGYYQQAGQPDTATVEGTVTSDEDGQPLAGVTIQIKDTQKGTTTDKKGRFAIDITSGDSNTLVFSFVGYQTREVPIDGKTNIDISLQKEVEEMEDIVVVGYGSQRRQDLTGSVSSVSAGDFENQPITSADQAMQGQISGVQVTRNSGAPGGGSTVRIRGTNSIRAGNNPLYVIDGMPVGGGSSPSQNPLSLINPQDIVSIEVLKDASATAIYGARGANGVVLITTTQGQEGDALVDLEMRYGVNTARNKLDLLNTDQFITLANEAATNDGADPIFTNPSGQYPDTDWQDEVLRSAPQQNVQLSVSGGNETTRYALSANFLNEEGILIGSGYKRGSFRINFDKSVTDRFTIGNNLIISQAYYDLLETGGRELSGIVNGAIQIPSVVPVKDNNGNYVFQTANTIERDNPVASAREKTNTNNRFKSVGNIFAQYMITQGLEARVSFGGNINYNKSNFYAPRSTLEGRQNSGSASVSSAQSFRWVNENT
ncbi:MAG TPA: SusC/RagA family TonB-linked outer membrane protein, partial [Fodinibius sp.]|nr:SusC/RagA family TonB-linked outer membrane protein [Fodinibius sp.]